MKKRFLLQALCLLCAMSSFALSFGEYVYTPTARFKVYGDNIITNGSFTNEDVTSSDFGWYSNAEFGTVSTDYWSIEQGAGPNGETVLQSISTDENATLFRAIPYEATKSYIITFKIKGPEDAMSQITAGQLNFINVIASEDGSTTAITGGQVASGSVIGTDWTEISYSFTDPVDGGKAGYLVINMGRLTYGTQITGFEMHEVLPVYDDRIALRAVNFCKSLVNSGEFTNGVDEFNDVLSQMDAMLQEPGASEDPASMEALLESLDEERETFLDANSTEVMSYITNGLTASWPKFNNGDNRTAMGDWVLAGAALRWGHGSGLAYANYSYQMPYQLGWGSAYISKSGMPAGRYMFTAEALALKYIRTAAAGNYGANYAVFADGFKMFVGKDTVECGRLDNRVFTTYAAFGNIAEGEDLVAGVYFPGFEEGTGGGTFQFASKSLRILGVTAEDLARLKFVESIHTQQVELLKRINLAKADLESGLPWGRVALDSAILSADSAYNASLVYVSADGEDLGLDIPEGYDVDVKNAVNSLNGARNTFANINVPYTNLVAYVAVAQASYDNEANANALASARVALKEAIDAANALIAGVTAEPDAETFVAMLATLQDAVVTFELSTATFENPADLVIVNPSFKQNSGQKSGKCEGWELTLQADNKGWLYFQADENFEMGYKAYASRGVTAYSQNKAIQKITVSDKGMYAFKTQAYAFNGDEKRYNGMWNGMTGEDSLRISGIYLFFGPENAPDSVNVCTRQTTFGNTYQYDELRDYIMYYDKKTEGEEILEFGMDALNNGVPMGYGCCNYGFGSNHIYYFGDTDKFNNGIESITGGTVNINNRAVYTLTGVKVGYSMDALPKGVYICNGKKFVVK